MSSCNHYVIMRTHRWPYGPCFPPEVLSSQRAMKRAAARWTLDNNNAGVVVACANYSARILRRRLILAIALPPRPSFFLVHHLESLEVPIHPYFTSLMKALRTDGLTDGSTDGQGLL